MIARAKQGSGFGGAQAPVGDGDRQQENADDDERDGEPVQAGRVGVRAVVPGAR
ncbi:hypothetical protein [Amycolatopsis sp. NPDC051061]|uniref:hypothetical protein n=1 Tax=Amycolatopsis sp. NPDC051061 TaxID=3155042 RepID=UPI00341BE382